MKGNFFMNKNERDWHYELTTENKRESCKSKAISTLKNSQKNTIAINDGINSTGNPNNEKDLMNQKLQTKEDLEKVKIRVERFYEEN